jgi:hypothetical protein
MGERHLDDRPPTHPPRPSGAVQAKPRPEYLVKAEIIRKLLDYMEWPTGNSDRPIVVGVLEPSPFGDFLPKTLENSVIRGRSLQLRFLRGISQIGDCDVVFIPESSEDRLDEILRSLRGRPVLTVADTPGFGHRGAIVNLVLREGRTSLEINILAMKKSGVTISPQVIRNATIIQ